MAHTGAMKQRYGVLGFLISLFVITYLDRVCLSLAGPRIQDELGIGPIGWGWVTGMFTLSYCLFEIPTGALGDRIGPRRVLTRIVLWWSAFTALTGTVSNYVLLLVSRFCFGAGEAGVFPNSSIVVSRWFPTSQRAGISGVTLMSAQAGGALAPFLVVPLQMAFGWRVSFFVFGTFGVVWSAAWYFWFRDSPAEKKGVSASELAETAHNRAATHHPFPWRAALRSSSIRALLITTFCYVYVYNFFQSWLPTFLARGRGVSEAGLLLTALPFVLGAVMNLSGGIVSDRLVRRLGPKTGRKIVGTVSLSAAALFTLCAMFTKDTLLTVVFLSLVYGAITFQQSGVFGVCLDVGKTNAGAIVGVMNTAAQVGGFVGLIAYGYLVDRLHSYDAPFVPMTVLLLIGAIAWTRIDASEELGTLPIS
jgi:ACS family glucarate transporter-like MFS transporter